MRRLFDCARFGRGEPFSSHSSSIRFVNSAFFPVASFPWALSIALFSDTFIVFSALFDCGNIFFECSLNMVNMFIEVVVDKYTSRMFMISKINDFHDFLHVKYDCGYQKSLSQK